MVDVNIENIDEVDVEDFAIWARTNLGDVRIPKAGPNLAAASTIPAITSLLADIPSRMGLATELYARMAASVAKLKEQKAGLDKGELKANVENLLLFANTKQDILYRFIQTLTTQYEAASRIITVVDSAARLGPRQ